MRKKQFINKLNSQKGVTAADISIAMLIILVSVSVIGMVYTNWIIGSKDVDRKATATQIATSVMEYFRTLFYDDIENELNFLSNSGKVTKSGNIYTIGDGAFGINIPKAYKVQLSFSSPSGAVADIVKKTNVTVTYKTNGQDEKVELSKIFEKENVRECNSPNFEKEYLKDLGIEDENYIFGYTANAGNSAGNKIICPIQYDSEVGYKIVDENTIVNNEAWYSYSNKQWARVLVLNQEEFKTKINSVVLTVNDPTILVGEKSYVWIPRFGVKQGGDSFGDTFFKYKSTNRAILNSYKQNNLLQYYVDTMDEINWSENYDIKFNDENKELLGKWVPYSEIEVEKSAQWLNNSQYGPLLKY